MQLEIEWDCLRHYVRNTPVMAVGNEVLAQSLSSQGIYAEVNSKDKKTSQDRVRISGKVYLPDSLVAFAKRITVNGVPVKWLLNDEYDYRKKGPLLITSLSPAEFYRSVKAGYADCNLWVGMVVWLLHREGEIYEYAELGEAEYDLQTSQIADDLCQDALAVGAPELLKTAQTKGVYENVLRNLHHAARNLLPSLREYALYFGVTPERLRRAGPEVMIMHPGPMNRGIEISQEVAEDRRNVILDQVTKGVAVRMAGLYLLNGNEPASREAEMAMVEA